MNKPLYEAEDTMVDMVADFMLQSNPSVDWSNLVDEEYLEWVESHEKLFYPPWVTNKEKEEDLKEVCDLLYVVIGYAIANGYNVEEAFKRVHESNMSKRVDGKFLKNEDGKVIKGDNYKKPDLSDLV